MSKVDHFRRAKSLKLFGKPLSYIDSHSGGIENHSKSLESPSPIREKKYKPKNKTQTKDNVRSFTKKINVSNIESYLEEYCGKNKDDPLLYLYKSETPEFHVITQPRLSNHDTDKTMVLDEKDKRVAEPIVLLFAKIYNRTSYRIVVFNPAEIETPIITSPCIHRSSKRIVESRSSSYLGQNNKKSSSAKLLIPRKESYRNLNHLKSNPKLNGLPSKRQYFEPIFSLVEQGKKIEPKDIQDSHTQYYPEEKIRISEGFYFMWNAHLLPQSKTPETSGREFTFHTLEESEDILLVARVACPESFDSKNETKEKKRVFPFVRTSSVPSMWSSPEATAYGYRPLLWGSVRLFSQNNTNPQILNLHIPKGAMDDELIPDSLDDKHRGFKKTSDGTLTLTLESVPKHNPPPGCLSPSLVPLKPYNKENIKLDDHTKYSNIIRELQNFEDDNNAYTFYVNNIYVYPIRVGNLKSPKGGVIVTVQLMDIDHPEAKVRPYVYGTCLQEKLTQVGVSVLATENKPTFYDEFKIQLPPVVHELHHLLFTVIVVDNKKGQQVIGYVVHPLLENGELPNFPEIYDEIPIMVELPPNYITTKTNKTNTKATLCFRLKLVSSVLLQDKYIHDLLHHSNNTNRPDTKQIMNLQYANPHDLQKFFLTVSFELLKIICLDQVLGKEAFIQWATIIKMIYKESKTKQIKFLREYTQYQFDNVVLTDPNNQFQVYEAVTKYFLALLQENHLCVQDTQVRAVMLSLITKSMALHLYEANLVESPRLKRFDQQLIQNLISLAKELLPDQSLHISVAIFYRELLCLVDRGIVFKMIEDQFSLTSLAAKMTFLQTISEYHFYIVLNLPLVFKIPKDIEWKDFTKILAERHSIGGKIVQTLEYFYTLKSKDLYDHSLRSRAISLFFSILSKHEADRRYKDRAAQTYIGSMYFPFLLIPVEDTSPLLSMAPDEKSNWLLCFVYLLRACDESLFQSWMAAETKRRQMNFYWLLYACLQTFENSGTELMLQLSAIVLQALSDFTRIYAKDLNEEYEKTSGGFSIFKHIVQISSFLFGRESDQIREMVLGYAHQIVEACPKALFPDTGMETNHDYLEILTVEFMKCCNSGKESIRSQACNLLYKLLITNQKLFSNISRMKVRVSIATAKLIGSQANSYTELQKSLCHLKTLLSTSPPPAPAPPTFTEEVLQMVDHVETLIQQSVLIKENSGDPEMLAALYHRISNGFAHSPKLRITWLNNLTEVHIKNNNRAEAGQCKMMMAALITRFLKAQGLLKRTPAYFELLFEAIAPGIGSIKMESEEHFNNKGDNWTVLQLIETLEEAVQLFEEATLWELCLEVYSLLSLLYKSERKYPKLMTTLESHQTLLEKMTDSPTDRLVPVYFRVAFYGSRWSDELRGKQFIYKKGTECNLSLMIKQMEDQYSQKYGSVVVLSKNNKIEEYTLEEDKVYIQIAGVVPYVGSEEQHVRVTLFDQNFNIEYFLFETAFSEDGKSITDDLASQMKKKIIFKTKYPFPHVENRIEVEHFSEYYLSPLENAIELITHQTTKVQNQLEAVPTRVNPLQQTLQGSVVPMVNPGPIRVCETFLTKEAVNSGLYPQKDIIRLIVAMEVFVKKCGFAVKLNQYVMEEKHSKFTVMIEKSYAQLALTVNNAVTLTRQALEKNSGLENV